MDQNEKEFTKFTKLIENMPNFNFILKIATQESYFDNCVLRGRNSCSSIIKSWFDEHFYELLHITINNLPQDYFKQKNFNIIQLDDIKKNKKCCIIS